MKKILIAIINYKCEQEVLDYAMNLSKQTAKNDIFLAVVNNLSLLDNTINLQTELSKIQIDSKVYYPDENLGYLNGVLFAYEMFSKDFDYLPGWLVVSNTDIIIEDEQFYNKFLSTKYSDDIWCVAPSVLANNKTKYSNPHYKQRIPLKQVNRVIKMFSNKLLSKIYLKLSAIKARFSNDEKQDSQFIYSSHGCFFILRKEFYDYLNGEKYGAFLYSEESYIAEHILKAQKQEFYDSTLELIHNENLSTGKINESEKYKMRAQSMQYIKDKFYL